MTLATPAHLHTGVDFDFGGAELKQIPFGAKERDAMSHAFSHLSFAPSVDSSCRSCGARISPASYFPRLVT